MPSVVCWPSVIKVKGSPSDLGNEISRSIIMPGSCEREDGKAGSASTPPTVYVKSQRRS